MPMSESDDDAVKSSFKSRPFTSGTGHHSTGPAVRTTDVSRRSAPLSGAVIVQLAAVAAAVAAALLTARACAGHSAWLQRELRAAAARSLLFWEEVPAGHRQPLGHHRPPLTETIDRLDRPPRPGEFFSRYVRPQRPVIFRGLARIQPAYQLWTDDYLRSVTQDRRLLSLGHFAF